LTRINSGVSPSRRASRWTHSHLPAADLDDIEAAYDLFGHQRDGVLKVAITP
jgi:threonine dehydrogenase-like Zn-dependent dehydrogenase